MRQFYLSRGYADINIKRARGGLLPDRSGFAISFVLEEGPLYQFDKIEIVSKIENINADELDTALTFISGDRYDVRKLEESLLAITNRLGNLGYAFVNVSPTIATDPDNGLLNIKISVDPSRKNYVERIEIIDNLEVCESDYF